MILSVFTRVFSRTRYILIATLIAIVAVSVAILLPNIAVLLQVIVSQDITILEKVTFVVSMYGALFTNFTPYSAVFTVVIAVLFGMNSALLAYYIRRRQIKVSNNTGHAAGFLGTVSGLFGIGCAACGSVIISGLLALVGAGGLLTLLPFHGAEFGLLGVILLSYSAYELSKRINDPLVCSL